MPHIEVWRSVRSDGAQTKKSRRTLALRGCQHPLRTFDPGSFTQSSKKIDLAWSIAVCAVNNEGGVMLVDEALECGAYAGCERR